MGGTIRVINKIDNKIVINDRWTNNLPEYVKNEKFFDCDRQYVADYISRREDQFDDTGVYPVAYGLDFFDFDNKVIYTMQSYTSYNSVDPITLHFYYNGNVLDNGKPITQSSPYFLPNTIKAMWDRGFIDVLAYKGDIEKGWKEENEIVLTKEEVNLTFEECYELMRKTNHLIKNSISEILLEKIKSFFAAEMPLCLLEFRFNFKNLGWTLKEYDETEAGCRQYIADLQAAGLISESDLPHWEEFIKEISE